MQATDLKQIYWRSRRGMLELELKLMPFVRDEYRQLDPAQQQVYERLLAEDDWQIYDWLQQREQPEDPQMRAVVAKIIAHTGRL